VLQISGIIIVFIARRGPDIAITMDSTILFHLPHQYGIGLRIGGTCGTGRAVPHFEAPLE
jgi:hypothetical protein